MSEFNPQITTIKSVEHHPNADKLDIVDVLGYPAIVKRDAFKVGDLCAYLPIDSVVDILRPEFNFLDKPRLKAKKLRGIYSQGLVIEAPEGFNDGDSIVDHFGIKKWVYPEELDDILSLPEEERKKYYITKGEYPKQSLLCGCAESPPKGWSVPYYDLDSVRTKLSFLKDGEEVIITEKQDGSNFSAVFDGDRLWVKSRKLYKKKDIKNDWWDAAIKYDLESKLVKYPMLTFFGELIGKVNPFYYNCKFDERGIILSCNLSFFDIFNQKTMKFLDYDDMMVILNDLDLPAVPVIYRGPWKSDKSLYQLAEMDSPVVSKHPKATKIMEGFVARPVKERVEHCGRVVFKLKSERYNLFKG